MKITLNFAELEKVVNTFRDHDAKRIAEMGRIVMGLSTACFDPAADVMRAMKRWDEEHPRPSLAAVLQSVAREH